MSKELRAVVIGLWRQGATLEEIIGATLLVGKIIEKIIKEQKL